MKSKLKRLLTYLFLGTLTFTSLDIIHAQDPVDCSSAIAVCDSEQLNYNSNGPGIDDFGPGPNDFSNGCLTDGEHQSAWFLIYISPSSPPNATLAFTLTPTGGPGQDYDFALYGPNVDCGGLGDPIRCSYAAGNCGFCPETGLGMGTTDFSEGAAGDGFVAEVETQPGQSYILLIDNWSNNNQGFFLDWTGTAILSCACTTIPLITGDQEICENETTVLTATGTNLNGYIWAATGGGSISGPTNAASITATSPGTYTVTVSDTDGCSGSTSVEVTEAPAPEIAFTVLPSTCGQNNGSINLTITGGSAPYTFNWSNGENTEDISGLAEGNYTVTVTGSEGCTATMDIEVTEDIAVINVSGIVNDNTSCTGGNGSITTMVNPPGMYTYEWSNGMTEANITGLVAGTYVITVTSSGSCTGTAVFTIEDDPNEPQITSNNTPSLCDLANGEIDITVSEGETPYQYNWSNGETSEDLENLQAGSYTVTVTADNGCSAVLNVVVTNNNPTLTITSSIIPNTSCNVPNGGINITINPPVSPTGMPYTYIWSNGSTDQNLSGISPGTYTITVSAGGSCTQEATFIVPDQPNLPVINSTIIPANCGQSNGSIQINVSGGVAPFNFTWNEGSTSSSLTGIPAGNYSVTVTGDNGCTATGNFAVPDEPINFTVNSVVQPNTSCTGDGNGSITISVVPAGNYTYEWSNGANQASITDLIAGNYTLTVSAGGTCEQVLTFTVNDMPVLPQFNVQITPSMCDEADGGATIVITGGEAPFTFLWSNGEVTQGINNVASGTYTVTVTGDNDCTASASVVIPNESIDISVTNTITANTSCTSGNGSIDLTVSPPTGLTFQWSNGETGPDINDLVSGSYTVTISAGGSCEEIFDFIVPDDITLPVINLATVSATCGQENGSINLTVSSGQAPFEYEWSNGEIFEDLSMIASGTYSVTVTDALGCTNTASTTVNDNIISLDISGIAEPNTSCDMPNGEISISVSPPGSYNFEWSNGDDTQDLTGLDPGTYFVTVTLGDLCSATASFTVENQTSDPVVDASIIAAICGEDNGSIDLTVSGSIPPYSFLWSTGDTDEDITDLFPGNYYVTVTGSNDCSAILSLNVPNNSSSFTILGETTPLTHCVQNNGAIDLSIDPPGSYEYAWSNGETTEDLNNLVPGEYSVTVTLSGSCSGSATFTVEDETITPSYSANINFDECDLATGSIELLNVTGTTPINFLWSGGETTSGINNLIAGTYSVTITDANGCTTTSDHTIISNSIDISLSGSALPNTSCAIPNGSIDITASPGGTYSYAWSNGDTTEDLTGLASGNYTVTVSYGSCSATAAYFVDADASAISLNGSSGDVSCYGQSDGNINLELAGGVQPYLISWSPVIPGSPEDPTGLPAGNYSVTITDQAGCVATSGFIIDQPDELILNCRQKESVSAPGEMDGSADIDINGGTSPYSITWTGGAQSGLLPGTFNIPGLGEGDYQVEVIDANGCISMCNFSITAEACITATGSMSTLPNVICGDGCVTVTYDNTGEMLATGDILQFILHEGTGNQIQNEIARSLQPQFCFDASVMQFNKQYYISAAAGLADGSGNVLLTGSCAQVANGTPVIFHEIPIASIDDPGQVNCDQPEVEITGHSSITLSEFLWTTKDGNILTDPTATTIKVNKGGTYELIVTSNTCRDTAGVDVDQSDDYPLLLTGPVGDLNCIDSTVTLTGSTNQTGVELQWTSIVNGDTILLGIGDSLVVNTPGIYHLLGIADNGCMSSMALTVEERISSPFVDIGDDITLSCDVSSQIISANSSAGVTFLWTAPPGISLPINDQATLNVDQPGVYTVVVTDTLSYCVATDSIEVFQNQDVPVSDVLVMDISCFSSSDGSIIVEPQQGTGPFEFILNEVSQGINNQFTTLQAGSYLIEVIDNGGCRWSQEIIIEEPDPLTVDLGPDISAAPGEMITIEVEANILPEQIALIEWTQLPGLNCLGEPCISIQFSLIESTHIEVTLTDENGCRASDDLLVTIISDEDIFAPNIFSPGGDGQNDVFTLYAGSGVRMIRHLSIYSRWGDLLFVKENFLPNDLSSGWDGTSNGQRVNPGVYVWRAEIEFQDGDVRTMHGDVTAME